MPIRTLLISMVALALGCTGAASRPLLVTAAPGEVWFPDVGSPLELTAPELVAMAAHLQARLDGHGGAALPPRLARDQEPRVLLVSVARPDGPAAVAPGTGHGIAAALDDAARALAPVAGTAGPGMGPAARPGRELLIKLDLVTASEPARMLRWGDDLALEPGLDGVAFARGSRLALLGEELIARQLVHTRAGSLRRARVAAYVAERGPGTDVVARILAHRGPMPVYRFRTASAAVRGTEVRRLVRGHRAEVPVRPAELRASVAAGAAYLARAVAPDGRFAYRYWPARDQDDDAYNMVRHAGTAWAMMQAWQRVGAPELRAAAERALAYLARWIEPFGPAPGVDLESLSSTQAGSAASASQMAVVAFRGKIKLGGVALAALAMSTHAQLTGERTYVPLAHQLGRYIRASQRPDGSFLHQRRHPSGRPRDFVSQYYPGEALLALVSLYRLDRDPAWLDSAERGARYLIEVRDRGLATAQLTHDHWLLYALAELQRLRPRGLYLQHALRIAEAIRMAQRGVPGRPATAPELAGSFVIRPGDDGVTLRSAPVATRSEGLMAVHGLARAAGRDAQAALALAAAQRAARFQLITQIDAIRAMYLPNPAAAVGGFGRSLTRLDIRIDYVQHNLSALIALLEVLEGRRS